MKRVLVIDVGGTNVKFVATGHTTPRRFPSGPKMTPRQMVAEIKKLTADWKYDVISIGYPGVVKNNRVVLKPKNLGAGWVGFDFQKAFGRPLRLINDAVMQALGSYRGGLMLFLGLGTGLGSALIADGVVIPLELAHMPYQQGTYEDYVGICAFKRLGRRRWRLNVINVTERFIEALRPDEVVLGGGGSGHLTKLPKGCRLGGNDYAFLGGFRLWESAEQSRRR